MEVEVEKTFDPILAFVETLSSLLKALCCDFENRVADHFLLRGGKGRKAPNRVQQWALRLGRLM